MRPPVRSETEAFRFVLAFAVAVGSGLLVGWLVTPVAGVGVFAAVFLIELIVSMTGEAATAVRDAELAGHRQGIHAPRLVLVVANARPDGNELWHELVRPYAPRPVIEVFAPVLQSRTHFVTTDIDREIAEAEQRLECILAWAAQHGIPAHGEVGDPISPIATLTDELRRYDIDQILVTEHPPEHASWVETALIGELRKQACVPLNELVS